MLDLVPANLPKNVNGFRTTHTCELCGFEPKTKNKYREKQDHLVMKHFKEKIDKIFPHSRPYACPTAECGFQGKDKQALLRHYTGKHGILEKYLKEALAEKGTYYFLFPVYILNWECFQNREVCTDKYGYFSEFCTDVYF